MLSELSYFVVVVVLDIYLALDISRAKKHRHCSGHNLGKDVLKS